MATAAKEKPQGEKQPVIKATGRSASYPWIDLQAAVERLEEFWKVEKAYEVPVSSAYKHWGYGAKSSGARLTLAAMLNYGLLTDRGSNEQRMVKVTPLGIEIVMAPSTEVRERALKAAAVKPKTFADLLKTIDPENPPSDQTIAHQLVTQKGFNPNAIQTFLKNFKGTVQYAKLKKSDILSTGEPAKAQDEDDAGLQGKVVNLVNAQTAPNAGAGTAAKSAAVPQHGAFKQDVYNFADGGQVILQWPDGMTADDFEEFEEWIELQKKKIKKASTKSKDSQ